MKPYLFIFFFFCFLNLFNTDQWKFFTRIKSILGDYFSKKDSPFNIAVFRIAFFFWVLIFAIKAKADIVWFSQLPADMQFPPVGMKWFLSVVPVTPDLVQKVAILFIGFSFLAMVGCFAQASSLLAALCGIYYLGIPEFYGKVDHNNHFIWFMFILSASRCSDVLSVDAIWKAFREADQGRKSENRNSVVYAMPLRFIWLLLGGVYFFPGFWKLYGSQGAWAWSDHLKYQLYSYWFELGGWLPFFRLDQHPFLCRMCGLGIIVFELLFVFLILLPLLRPIAVILGILFHSMLKLFMCIDFSDLQLCYVSFINWAGLFAKIGKWIFKEPLHVSYKEKSINYRRMMAVLSRFDIFQRMIFSDQIQPLRKPPQDQKILKITGIALLSVNALFGFKAIESGWPFACYPTFSRMHTEATTEDIKLYGVIENKEEIISSDLLKQRMQLDRFNGMIRNIIAIPDQGQRKSKLKTLVSIMKKEGVDLRGYSKIHFYRTTCLTQPGKANEPPILKELLEEIDI
jgi:hypothetical protein